MRQASHEPGRFHQPDGFGFRKLFFLSSQQGRYPSIQEQQAESEIPMSQLRRERVEGTITALNYLVTHVNEGRNSLMLMQVGLERTEELHFDLGAQIAFISSVDIHARRRAYQAQGRDIPEEVEEYIRVSQAGVREIEDAYKAGGLSTEHMRMAQDLGVLYVEGILGNQFTTQTTNNIVKNIQNEQPNFSHLPGVIQRYLQYEYGLYRRAIETGTAVNTIRDDDTAKAQVTDILMLGGLGSLALIATILTYPLSLIGLVGGMTSLIYLMTNANEAITEGYFLQPTQLKILPPQESQNK